MLLERAREALGPRSFLGLGSVRALDRAGDVAVTNVRRRIGTHVEAGELDCRLHVARRAGRV